MARHGQQQWSFDHGMPPDWPFDSHSIKIKTLCNKMIKGVKAVTSNLLSTYPKKKKLNGNFEYHIPGSDFKRITHILKYQHEAVLYLGLKCLDLDLWSFCVKYWPLQTGQHSPSVLSIYGHMVTLWHDSCLQNVSPRLQVHLTHLSGLQLWPSRYSFSVPVSSVRQLRSVSIKEREGKSISMMMVSTFLR